MKKNCIRMIACALALVMILALGACGGKMTVESFVKSDIVQNQIDQIKGTLADQGMNIEVTAEGNKLVYIYTFTEALEEGDRETLAAALESGMESQASTFEGIADSLKDTVKQDDVSVEVRYVDSNGEVIFSQEFKPTK